MTKPTFEIVRTTAGATSIRDNVTGEIMHNPVGPWVESNALYIDQSRLAERLRESATDPLVIFDVGLGAAANSLAVLHCARDTFPRRSLHLISFERDLTLLQFALDHAASFAHFAGFEDAVHSILETGHWTEDGLTWELRHGDYPSLIRAEPNQAHLVFYDPYSPTKNVDMWTVETFRATRAKCVDKGCLLLTYSRATPVRVALLMAGFYVGVGLSSGLKDETTQAATRRVDLTNPLGPEWLKRWERSHTPHPPGATERDVLDARRLITQHELFT